MTRIAAISAISAVALAVAAALPMSAAAQSAEETVVTTQGGPKRMKVPGLESSATTGSTGTTASGTTAETEGAATDPEIDPETAADPERAIELLPEASETAGAEDTTAAEPEAGADATTAAEPAEEEQATGGAAAETEEAEVELLPEAGASAEPEATVVAQTTNEIGTGPFVGDYTIGDPEAPVQIIEYASLTCPHCAAFHRDAWPQLKEEYVEPGKIGFTMRDVYFDRYGIWASMTARCAGEAGYYPMVDQFLTKQQEWTRADDIAAAIQQIGRLNGLTTDQLKACLENQDFAKLLVEEYQTNAEADEVTSTPTFLIRGPGGEKKVSGNMSYEEFRALVDEAMGGS